MQDPANHFFLVNRESLRARRNALVGALVVLAFVVNRMVGLFIEPALVRWTIILAVGAGLMRATGNRIDVYLQAEACVTVSTVGIEIVHPALETPLRISPSNLRAVFVEDSVRQRGLVRSTRLFRTPDGFLFEHVYRFIPPYFMTSSNIALMPVLTTANDLPTIALAFEAPSEIAVRKLSRLSFGSSRAISDDGLALGVMLAVEEPTALAAALSGSAVQRQPSSADFDHLAGPRSSSLRSRHRDRRIKGRHTIRKSGLDNGRSVFASARRPNAAVGYGIRDATLDLLGT